MSGSRAFLGRRGCLYCVGDETLDIACLCARSQQPFYSLLSTSSAIGQTATRTMEDAEEKIRKRHFRRPTLHNDGTLKVLLFLNVFVCKNTPGESIDGEGVTEIN